MNKTVNLSKAIIVMTALMRGWQVSINNSEYVLDKDFCIRTFHPTKKNPVASFNAEEIWSRIQLSFDVLIGYFNNITEEELRSLAGDLAFEDLCPTTNPAQINMNDLKLKGVSSRISELFTLIDKREIDEAKRLLNELEKEVGSDSTLMKANVLIQRYECIGK